MATYMTDKYYSLVAAAEKLNISKAKLYTMIKDGILPFHQPSGKGGKIYIDEEIILNPEEYIINTEADKNYRKMLSRMGYRKI